MAFSRLDTVLLEIGDEEFRLWTHNPISAAYLQFMEDQVAVWRELAADLLEAGAFGSTSQHEDANPNVVRGRILALRDLRRITLGEIQAFYGKEPAAESEEDQEHE